MSWHAARVKVSYFNDGTDNWALTVRRLLNKAAKAY